MHSVGWEVYQFDMNLVKSFFEEKLANKDREIAELKDRIAVMVCSMGEIRVEKIALSQSSGDDLTNGNIELYENPKDFNWIYKWKGKFK